MSKARDALVRVSSVTFVLLPLFAVPAVAQKGVERTVTVTFQSGSGSSGYEQASIGVRYAFYNCLGDIAIGYALLKGSVRAGPAYWYRGQQVTATGAPDEPRTIFFAGGIFQGNARVGSFRDDIAGSYSGAGCLGQSQVVFKKPAHLRTDAQIQAYLDALTISVQAPPPLRNSRVETEILVARRKARKDSIAHADAARRDSIERVNVAARARRDSLNRVAARRRDSLRLASQRFTDSLARVSANRADSLRRLAKTRQDSLALAAHQRQDSIEMARKLEELAREEQRVAEETARAERAARDPQAVRRRERERADSLTLHMMGVRWRAEAAASETEGDRLYNLGLYFRPQALAKYREAQNVWPSQRVQQKIANIETQLQALQAAEELKAMAGEAIGAVLDAAEDAVDAAGIRKFSGSFIALEGLSDSRPEGEARSPRSIMYGYSALRVVGLEVRMGYMETMPARHDVQREVRGSFQPQATGDTVTVSHSGLGLGFSLSVGAPIRSIVPYIGYGLNAALLARRTVSGDGYEADKGLGMRLTHFYSIGVNVPLSRVLGVGVQYNGNSEVAAENGTELTHPTDTDPDNAYVIARRTTPLKHHTFSVRFFWDVGR